MTTINGKTVQTPRTIRIPRTPETERLYKLELAAETAFRKAAQELAKVRNDSPLDFWTVTLPQALFDFLDGWHSPAVLAACKATVERIEARDQRDNPHRSPLHDPEQCDTCTAEANAEISHCPTHCSDPDDARAICTQAHTHSAPHPFTGECEHCGAQLADVEPSAHDSDCRLASSSSMKDPDCCHDCASCCACDPCCVHAGSSHAVPSHTDPRD